MGDSDLFFAYILFFLLAWSLKILICLNIADAGFF